MASVPLPRRSWRPRRRLHGHPAKYLVLPVGLLLFLLVAPMTYLLVVSLRPPSITGISGPGGPTLSNYEQVLTTDFYRQVFVTSALISTTALVITLAIGIGLAYILAFRAGRLEMLLLLLLVLADQTPTITKVYAWRILLGRQGVINSGLERLGLDEPIDALLFSRAAVIIVLSVTFIPFATIPVYAAMKAIDLSLLESANDLGAGFMTRLTRIILPLAAPGIFIAIILVYIPLFSEFIAPTMVGGTTGYMIGSAISDQILDNGNWGVGTALSFILLLMTAAAAAISYYLARIKQLSSA